MNIFKTALELQGACNLRAIARVLVMAADRAADEGGTAASYSDPAVVLIVGKMESLVHSAERFSDAYEQCAYRAECDK